VAVFELLINRSDLPVMRILNVCWQAITVAGGNLFSASTSEGFLWVFIFHGYQSISSSVNAIATAQLFQGNHHAQAASDPQIVQLYQQKLADFFDEVAMNKDFRELVDKCPKDADRTLTSGNSDISRFLDNKFDSQGKVIFLHPTKAIVVQACHWRKLPLSVKKRTTSCWDVPLTLAGVPSGSHGVWK
jgi:hypothetical protein